MGRRPYGAEKWRKEQARKAKRDAKLEKKREGKDDVTGSGPPIDWEAMVGGPEGAPPAEGAEPQADEAPRRAAD